MENTIDRKYLPLQQGPFMAEALQAYALRGTVEKPSDTEGED